MSGNKTVVVADSTTLNYFQVACAAISIYSSIEILALAFTTFARYNTLYFASIVGCASGCILFAGGFLDIFYHLFDADGVTVYRPLFILTFGWYAMVTGFSLVMYSRLHLVSVPQKYIRIVKYMIIFNVIFSHFPTTVLTFGSFVVATEPWVNGYAIYEKVQMTFFCIQEVTLGTLYLVYTRRLRLHKKVTHLVTQTLYINMMVLGLDIAMLFLEYANLYNYQIMLKVVVYSVKLKLEFFILNLLTKFVQQNMALASEGGNSKGNNKYVYSDAHMSSRHASPTGKEIAPAGNLSDAEMDKAQSVSDSISGPQKTGEI
jgi:hypothetical protein